MALWKIRYEGCPTNPRFRINKRRTAKVIGSEEDAKTYADSLVRGQHVKVISISSLAGKQRPRPKYPLPIFVGVGSEGAEALNNEAWSRKVTVILGPETPKGETKGRT